MLAIEKGMLYWQKYKSKEKEKIGYTGTFFYMCEQCSKSRWDPQRLDF